MSTGLTVLYVLGISITFLVLVLMYKRHRRNVAQHSTDPHANNERAFRWLVFNALVSAFLLIYVGMNLYGHMKHPQTKQMQAELTGRDTSSILKSDDLSDPRTFFGITTSAKDTGKAKDTIPLQVVADPLTVDTLPWWVISPFWIFFIFCLLVISWIASLIYWAFAQREEVYLDLKNFIDRMAEKRREHAAQRAEQHRVQPTAGTPPAGAGTPPPVAQSPTGATPSRAIAPETRSTVATSTAPLTNAATTPAASAAQVVPATGIMKWFSSLTSGPTTGSPGRGKWIYFVTSILAADEILELLSKVLGWIIRHKTKK